MLDGPLDPDLTFATFVVGPSNRAAYGEALAVATRNGGANPLFLHGATGVGKSHLLAALAHVQRRDARHGIAYVQAGTLLDAMVDAVWTGSVDRLLAEIGRLQTLVIDDVQAFAGRMESQRVLVRVLDLLRGNGAQLVLAADRRPEAVFGLYRLTDRMACGHVVALPAPDPATALRIVLRQARRHLIELPRQLAVVITESVGASVRELQGAVNRVVAHATLGGRAITLELVREALAVFEADPARGADRAAAAPPRGAAVADRGAAAPARAAAVPARAEPAPPLPLPAPAPPPARRADPPARRRRVLPPWRPQRRRRRGGTPGDLAAGFAELREFVRDIGGDRIGEPELDGRVVYVPMLGRGGERFILRVEVEDYLRAPPACTFVDERRQETPTAWPMNELGGPFRSPTFICTPPTKEFFAYHTERTYRYGDGSLVNTVGTIYAALAVHRGGRHALRGAAAGGRRNVGGF